MGAAHTMNMLAHVIQHRPAEEGDSFGQRIISLSAEPVLIPCYYWEDREKPVQRNDIILYITERRAMINPIVSEDAPMVKERDVVWRVTSQDWSDEGILSAGGIIINNNPQRVDRIIRYPNHWELVLEAHVG